MNSKEEKEEEKGKSSSLGILLSSTSLRTGHGRLQNRIGMVRLIDRLEMRRRRRERRRRRIIRC